MLEPIVGCDHIHRYVTDSPIVPCDNRRFILIRKVIGSRARNSPRILDYIVRADCGVLHGIPFAGQQAVAKILLPKGGPFLNVLRQQAFGVKVGGNVQITLRPQQRRAA